MPPRLAELAVVQTVDSLRPAHALLPLFTTGDDEVVTVTSADLRVLLPRLKVPGLLPGEEDYQLKSSSWRIPVHFCRGIFLSHGCSRDNLRDEVFPLLPVYSCSSWGLSSRWSTQGTPCGDAHHYTAYSEGLSAVDSEMTNSGS